MLNNLSGGVLEITNDAKMSQAQVPSLIDWTIVNMGTVRKSGGTGTTTLDVDSFTNTGTVEVLSGTLEISGAFGDAGMISLSAPGKMNLNGVTVLLPVFITQPLSQNAPLGTNLVLSAVAEGNPSPRYQWRKNGENIMGATSDSLILNNFLSANAGSYTVVATNGVGSISSATAVMSITAIFTTWQQSNFTLDEQGNPAISGPNAVYGQDGLPNLVKYALGLEPKQNITTGLPGVSIVGSDWVYTYTRPADRSGITYEVEVSTDLVSWTAAGVSHALVSSSGGVETWRGVYPLAAGSKVFFRLKVTQ